MNPELPSRIASPVPFGGLGHIPTLDADTINLYLARNLSNPADPDQSPFLDWLAPGERTRMERFATPPLRREYLDGKLLTRQVLSMQVSVHPRSLQFAANKEGKPFLEDPAAPAFNLSHVHGSIALGVSAIGDLGVDLELIDPSRSALEVAQRYFPPEECDYVFHDLPRSPLSRTHRFFIVWTLKEAFLKALGTGLSLPLHEVSVVDNDGQIAFQTTASARLRLRTKQPRLNPYWHGGVALLSDNLCVAWCRLSHEPRAPRVRLHYVTSASVSIMDDFVPYATGSGQTDWVAEPT